MTYLTDSMKKSQKNGQKRYLASRRAKLVEKLKSGNLKTRGKSGNINQPPKTPLKRNRKRLQPSKPLKRRNALKRVYKPTGELALFKQIYEERGKKCEITGAYIPFRVSSFMHILSKGGYPKFRLNPENIMHVRVHIHHLYDNCGQDKLLTAYPSAWRIYEKKQQLKQQYHK